MLVRGGRKMHEARRRNILNGRRPRRWGKTHPLTLLEEETSALETTAARLEFYGRRTYMEMVNLSFEFHKIPLRPGEKIRVRFLCIAAAYWQACQSIYAACLADARMDTRIILLDYEGGSVPRILVHCAGTRNFLEALGVSHVMDTEYSLNKDRPHIIFSQFPHDMLYGNCSGLRPDRLKSSGVRPLYCTYGIEYDESKHKPDLTKWHYQNYVQTLASSAFVMHEDIREGYFRFCHGGGAHVSVTGHPKFDAYGTKPQFPKWLEAKRQGRKILFIQIHHSNNHDARYKYRTHSLPVSEWVNDILPWLGRQEDFFCIISMHPLFATVALENDCLTQEALSRLRTLLHESQNTTLYGGDYQACLSHADAFISGQSSLLLEMAFQKKPILYLYDEPLALKPFAEEIFASFYHGRGYGHGLADVQKFLARLKNNKDPLADKRGQVWEKFFSHYDGQIGLRIKERMIADLSAQNYT